MKLGRISAPSHAHRHTILRHGFLSCKDQQLLSLSHFQSLSFKKEIGSIFVTFYGVLKGSPSPAQPGFNDSLRGVTGENTVILTTIFYYSETIQSKISKGRRHRRLSFVKTRYELPRMWIT